MKRVGDVMRRDVVTVSPDMSAREVARTLVREGIGGAPVTEGDGTVVGVVSARDVLLTAAREREVDVAVGRHIPLTRAPTGGDEYDDEEDVSGFFLPEDSLPYPWNLPEPVGDALDDRDASDIMTSAVFSVSADLPLEQLAEFLVRGRIHRALVLEDGRLSGIVTSFDVLRAFAGIHEESERSDREPEPGERE